MTRITSQKQKVLEYLENTNQHPTADKIYKEVKRDLPRISKSTVYRILDQFSKNKKIKKLDTGRSHFDATTSDHAHFVCKNCGKVRDMRDVQVPKISNTEYGKPEKAELFYYGICKKCRAEK